MGRMALVGQPNVGKSLLMNRLTGAAAFVSNYPGTTVEVTAGKVKALPGMEAVDTPGSYSLRAGSRDQQVTHRILLTEQIDLVVNVVDATNLERNLFLTLELLDFGLPVILALNQCDRLEPLGMKIDHERLARMLGVPVVPVSAARRWGLDALLLEMGNLRPPPPPVFVPDAEPLIAEVTSALDSHGFRRSRAWAIALLEMGEACTGMAPAPVRDLLKAVLEKVSGRASGFLPSSTEPPTLLARRKRAHEIAMASVSTRRKEMGRPRALDNPVIVIVTLVLGAYTAVFGVASGIRVSEEAAETLFRPIQYWLEGLARLIMGDAPWVATVARGIAEGLMVPFGTVMPSMAMVYMIMALLEDSGLLSRFAAASDAVASVIGLPGQSVIPLALGLGCRSPAVLASRLLPGMRERVTVVLLLAIAVPCAATMGIVTAVVARFGADLVVVTLTLAAAFALLGLGANRFLAGRPAPLIIELPPLRLPILSNVAAKTWFRMAGFFTHVLPVLLGMNIVVRILVEGDVLDIPPSVSALPVGLLGVRAEVLAGVLVTAVQRYLAPIVLLNLDLSAREATIACAMIVVSFPCMPVTALAIREIGVRRTAVILMIGAVLPLLVAAALNVILS